MFVPSERGQWPNALYLRCFGSSEGARGPTPYSLKGFWVFGKGLRAQRHIFYKGCWALGEGPAAQHLEFCKPFVPQTGRCETAQNSPNPFQTLRTPLSFPEHVFLRRGRRNRSHSLVPLLGRGRRIRFPASLVFSSLRVLVSSAP